MINILFYNISGAIHINSIAEILILLEYFRVAFLVENSVRLLPDGPNIKYTFRTAP